MKRRSVQNNEIIPFNSIFSHIQPPTIETTFSSDPSSHPNIAFIIIKCAFVCVTYILIEGVFTTHNALAPHFSVPHIISPSFTLEKIFQRTSTRKDVNGNTENCHLIHRTFINHLALRTTFSVLSLNRPHRNCVWITMKHTLPLIPIFISLLRIKWSTIAI